MKRACVRLFFSFLCVRESVRTFVTKSVHEDYVCELVLVATVSTTAGSIIYDQSQRLANTRVPLRII